jgi:hypothetical protein
MPKHMPPHVRLPCERFLAYITRKPFFHIRGHVGLNTFLGSIELKLYYNAPNLSLAIVRYGMQRNEYCILIGCVNVLLISNYLLHSAHVG